eukprot:SAG31_NODE_3126_length_4646_cov_6.852210_8_plen_73_part_01
MHAYACTYTATLYLLKFNLNNLKLPDIIVLNLPAYHAPDALVHGYGCIIILHSILFKTCSRRAEGRAARARGG